jgi:hypothetical protein
MLLVQKISKNPCVDLIVCSTVEMKVSRQCSERFRFVTYRVVDNDETSIVLYREKVSFNDEYLNNRLLTIVFM